MKFHSLHRHDGCGEHASSKNVAEAVGRHSTSLLSNSIACKILPVLSAMQESERGPYDPSGKFAFHTEHLVHTIQQNDCLYRDNGGVVNEKCRAKMLDWCSKVSQCS